MRVLFLGDIMGRSGRDAVIKHMPNLKADLKPDVIIVNGENAAHGKGITKKICEQLYEAGVHCITTGNHVWDQRDIILSIDEDQKLLRPLNFPDGTPGSGLYIHEIADGRKILIANIMARLFMDPLDDPFAAANSLVSQYALGRDVQAIFIDVHGETTSEKMALAKMLDGKVSAVVGTHTHIPTADGHVFAGGTAFQADAGMCGDYDSVIGIKQDTPIIRFSKKMPTDRNIPADGEGTICGCLIDIDDKTGKANTIEQVIKGPLLRNRMPALAA